MRKSKVSVFLFSAPLHREPHKEREDPGQEEHGANANQRISPDRYVERRRRVTRINDAAQVERDRELTVLRIRSDINRARAACRCDVDVLECAVRAIVDFQECDSAIRRGCVEDDRKHRAAGAQIEAAGDGEFSVSGKSNGGTGPDNESPCNGNRRSA